MQNITELLNQVVQDLVNPEVNLSDTLLKMKIVAFNLQNQQLKSWVEKEIGGYGNDDEIPEYRTVPTAVYGDLIQDLPGRTGYSRNTPLVYDYTSEETRNWLSHVKLNNPISEIEDYVKKGNDASFNVPHFMQMEITGTLSNLWHVQHAWRTTPNSYFIGIVSMIKNKLLDFVMELNATLGSGDISMPGQKQKVDDIFRSTVGSIQGGTVNINIGDKNNNLNVGAAHNSTVTQNASQTYTENEIEKIRELVLAIKADIDKHFEGDYREVMEAEIQKVETQLNKPSPIKLIINSALKVMYELMIEAAGSAYSPIILEQIRSLLG